MKYKNIIKILITKFYNSLANLFFKSQTAKLLIKRIRSESKLISVNILKLSDTNYRVYLGPFKDLKSLKKAFNDIKIINFENIEIIKT